MAKLEPPPDWRWGKGLAEAVVDDLLALCDSADQVSLALEAVRLLDQRTSLSLDGTLRHAGGPQGRLRPAMIEDWHSVTGGYVRDMLGLYVRTAASFATTAARTAQEFLRSEIPVLAETPDVPRLSAILERHHELVPHVHIRDQDIEPRTRDRMNEEAAHHRQRLTGSIEAFLAVTSIEAFNGFPVD